MAGSESARHLLLVAVVASLHEALFIHHWLNVVDEGLTLYAAMGVLRGGTLYQDVAFVFPPGHLLVAWIAYALDPPGVVLSRILYAAFHVALCLVLYLLGRRIMPPRYALLGAVLVALASPLSHRAHLLFGFRYLVWSALALLAFARRLRSGDARWMGVAGLWIGVAVCFRLTPAFAAAVGIGLGALAAARSPRALARDTAWFVAGGCAVVVPVVACLAADRGLETLWREIVVRPVVMTERQSLPLPDLFVPASLDRDAVQDAFASLLFRICAAVYAVWAVVGIGMWARAIAARRAFAHPLLVAIVAWGFVYFLRTLGRSDEPHLSSAIPPFLVLVAFLLHRLQRGVAAFASETAGRRAALAASAGVLLVWIALPGVDRALSADYRGRTPFEPLDGRVRLQADDWWHVLTPKIREIRQRTRPDQTILDLSASPLIYVLADRMGPGWFDVVMPGTFLDEAEERWFVEHLERRPPALVVLPATPFDHMESRSLARFAPRLMAWVGRRYGVVGNPEDWLLMQPKTLREIGPPGAAPAEAPSRPPPPPLVPLDAERPLDRLLLELAAELDANQTTDLLLRLQGLDSRLSWFEGRGAFALPPVQVALGSALREQVADAEDDALRAPLRLLLAHQQAHGMQSRIYTEASRARPGSRRLLEAQADLLAGISLVQEQLFAGRPVPELARAARRSVEFVERLGVAEGLEPPPLPAPLRLRLLQIGRNVGTWYMKVWICVTNRDGDDAEARGVYRDMARGLLADRRRNPSLPEFDPRRCEAEDVFAWTLRAAARELAREDAQRAASGGAGDGGESGAAPPQSDSTR